MKSLLILAFLLVAPLAAQACEGVGVCGQAVAVQSFAVQAQPQFQVQTFAPVYAQSFAVQQFAVQAYAVPQVAFVQQAHCNVGVQRVRAFNVRQPRQVVRQRSVVRSP